MGLRLAELSITSCCIMQINPNWCICMLNQWHVNNTCASSLKASVAIYMLVSEFHHTI